jgi:dTDP-4-dehydrorhamnose 3,5-epimerase
MNVIKTEFEGLLILEPKVMKDVRGHFFEAYNEKTFAAAGLPAKFVQDNQSRSSRGVLRGLHFQRPPHAQTKLVRVLHGRIQDVVVDLRKSQTTFGKSFSIELSSEDQKQLWIPSGFAHGFLVLSDYAEVLYKCDAYYHPEAEGGLYYGDSSLGIAWKKTLNELIISSRDLALGSFLDTVSEFSFD